MAEAAAEDVERAGMLELRVRALALEGEVRTDLGDFDAGIALVARRSRSRSPRTQSGRPPTRASGSASSSRTPPTRTGSRAAYETAYEFCRERGVDGLPEVCYACLAPVVLLTGEWRPAIEVCREVLQSAEAPPAARMVASGELALVRVLRGEAGRGRRRLREAHAFARQAEVFALESHVTMRLAR